MEDWKVVHEYCTQATQSTTCDKKDLPVLLLKTFVNLSKKHRRTTSDVSGRSSMHAPYVTGPGWSVRRSTLTGSAAGSPHTQGSFTRSLGSLKGMDGFRNSETDVAGGSSGPTPLGDKESFRDDSVTSLTLKALVDDIVGEMGAQNVPLDAMAQHLANLASACLNRAESLLFEKYAGCSEPLWPFVDRPDFAAMEEHETDEESVSATEDCPDSRESMNDSISNLVMEGVTEGPSEGGGVMRRSVSAGLANFADGSIYNESEGDVSEIEIPKGSAVQRVQSVGDPISPSDRGLVSIVPQEKDSAAADKEGEGGRVPSCSPPEKEEKDVYSGIRSSLLAQVATGRKTTSPISPRGSNSTNYSHPSVVSIGNMRSTAGSSLTSTPRRVTASLARINTGARVAAVHSLKEAQEKQRVVSEMVRVRIRAPVDETVNERWDGTYFTPSYHVEHQDGDLDWITNLVKHPNPNVFFAHTDKMMSNPLHPFGLLGHRAVMEIIALCYTKETEQIPLQAKTCIPRYMNLVRRSIKYSFPSLSEQAVDKIVERWANKDIFPQVHQTLYACYNIVYTHRDREFTSRAAELAELLTSSQKEQVRLLYVSRCGSTEAPLNSADTAPMDWSSCGEYKCTKSGPHSIVCLLRHMHTLESPISKLEKLQLLSRFIDRIVDELYGEEGIDLPNMVGSLNDEKAAENMKVRLLSWALCIAGVPTIVSEITYIDDFLSPDNLRGFGGFSVNQVKSAITMALEVDIQQLT